MIYPPSEHNYILSPLANPVINLFAGTTLEDLNALLRENGTFLMQESGFYILLDDGVELSDIPSFNLQNGNNIIQLHNIGFL